MSRLNVVIRHRQTLKSCQTLYAPPRSLASVLAQIAISSIAGLLSFFQARLVSYFGDSLNELYCTYRVLEGIQVLLLFRRPGVIISRTLVPLP